MPNKDWNCLSPLQLGTYAEYYAKMEFASYGFDVYTSEVDDHGVDFVAKSPSGIYYEVQVKSSRPDNTSYVFMKKSKASGLDDTHLLCYLRFAEGFLPEVYVIPFSVWKNPTGMFVDRDSYKEPEYGMNCSKRNMPQLNGYRSEVYLHDLLQKNR